MQQESMQVQLFARDSHYIYFEDTAPSTPRKVTGSDE